MNRTLVISIDALISADIERLKKLPNLGRIMKQASWAEDILCCYPTLTYPCHVTISTGCWPDRHGICNNEKFQPLSKDRPEWYWFRKDIKTPTLIDYAKAAGLTTAAITWPVMGDCGADYNIAEIWAPHEEDDPTPYFDLADSPKAKEIFERNKHMLRWMKTPQMDEFAAQCAVDIIKEYRPDLMFLHLSYVDHQRHKLGVRSEQLDHAFAFVDEQLGRVFDALDETGGLENTNIAVLGDHGQLYCDQMFHLNTVLRDMGFLTEENGTVTSWKIYAAQCAFSAQIYRQPDVDPKLVYETICKIRDQYPGSISQIFTKEQAADLHLTGEFDFVVEAGDRTAFDKTANATEYFTSVDEIREYKLSVSTHGHLPEKGDKPPFILSGPDVIPGKVQKGGYLVDEAPTLLRLLGITENHMDGTPFTWMTRL